jgi:hypothetical protein
MKSKIMLILVLSVLFVAFSLNSVNAENKVVSESIKVRVPVSNYDILFRIEGENRWQNLSNNSGFINGEHGSHLLNFDIKIVSRNGSASENLKQKVEFGYTLDGYLH